MKIHENLGHYLFDGQISETKFAKISVNLSNLFLSFEISISNFQLRIATRTKYYIFDLWN